MSSILLAAMSPDVRERLGTEEDIMDEELGLMKHWARFFYTRCPSDDTGLKVVPRANHLVQRAQTGDVEEYFTPPPNISPDVIETISRWILDRTRTDPAR